MSILGDVLGVFAVAGSIALALGVVAVLAAIEDERWWRRIERGGRMLPTSLRR